MKRKRMTREDSRDRTTQRLLAAGRRLIARRGLSDTSLEEIAEEAGHTRGAFYSNFSSKGDLFIELLRRDHETTTAQLRALRDDSLPLEHIQQRIREIHSRMYRTNETFMNWTEARMLAARDAKFRVKLDALLVDRRTEAAELIEYLYRRVGIAPPLAPEAVAMGLNSLFEGVKLTMLSSPGNMTSADAESVLTLFIDSLMHLTRLQGARKPTRGNGELRELPASQRAGPGTE
jgi:AcrR family transcriptional regulator